MVKRYGKPSYQYGDFVERQLQHYKPYKKEVVHYEFEKDKQKIKDDYKKQLQKYEKEIEDWKKEYVIQGSKHAHKSKWFGSSFEIRGTDRRSDMYTEIYLKEDPQINWSVNTTYLDIEFPNWKTEAIDIIGPPPQKPEKPKNYPRGRPRIKKTKKYKLTEKDKFYDEYLGRKKQYQTETTCTICNALIQFTKVRKPPFEDKCEICEYSFTFIYKKIKERYQENYDEKVGSRRIGFGLSLYNSYGDNYYDGIKPTRPCAPSKGDYVSDAKRKPIPQEVRDKVWNRDNGKCIQCGSNENLEFDHIIPVSKGGANTYRNIQLLCENCNRSKSDNIG